MMDFTATRIKNIEAMQGKYKRARANMDKGISGKLVKVGLKIQKESSLNAKRLEGHLEKSIRWRVSGSKVYIFVPNNVLAGKYAKYQHDGTDGRGDGTIEKSTRAGWKYIDRAIDDNNDWILKVVGESVKILKRQEIR